MRGRQDAQRIWQAALAAAAVRPLIAKTLLRAGDQLCVGPHRFDLRHDVRRVLVLGCGKASAAMAAVVEEILGDVIADGFVVVKDGYAVSTRRVRIAEAGHPVPDTRGQKAATALLDHARGATADDVVLVLISGGGSALTPAPAPPITLSEKQHVTRLLLDAGATINELNAVRKHISLFKGGQLARAAAPATVISLILSDVVGDPLDVIASGPTAPDPTTYADALAVLERRGVTARTPASVRARLQAGMRGDIAETPKPDDAVFRRVTNLVVGNNQVVVDAAAGAAAALGYRPAVLTRELQGEARDVARELVARARTLEPSACLIAGGETTVTVRGHGRGGRCQEFAVAAALEMRPEEPLVVLAAGTDGTDGPTDAAGGLTDAGTIARGRASGLDARRALDDNDTYEFLAATDDLVVTGPTNTNLLDLYICLFGCSSTARGVSEPV